MQLLLTQAMESLTVKDLMRTRFESVQPDAPLQAFIDEKLLRSDQIAWPVLRDRVLVGLIGLESIRSALKAERPPETVGDALVGIADSIEANVRGGDALKLLVASKSDPIPVLEAGQLVGLLFHADLVRWLALHEIESRQNLRA